MITQETAERIWKCYSEMSKGKNLIEKMEEAINTGTSPNPIDPYGREQVLKLGVPSGEHSHTLFDVNPRLALSVIRAHVAEKQKQLVEECERARIELDLPY